MASNIGYSISPFMDQTELTNVTIGNNVKIIGPYLFSGCSSLSEINTPNSLEQIGYGAFENCIYNHRTTKTNQKYPSVNL